MIQKLSGFTSPSLYARRLTTDYPILFLFVQECLATTGSLFLGGYSGLIFSKIIWSSLTGLGKYNNMLNHYAILGQACDHPQVIIIRKLKVTKILYQLLSHL